MNKQVSLSYKAMVLGITTVLLVALLGAFAGGIMFAPYVSGNAQAAPALPAVDVPPAAAQASNPSGDVLAAYEEALTRLYEAAVPSVVSINVTQKLDESGQLPRPFEFGVPGAPEGQEPLPPEEFFNRGQGTGFVWDTAGHIVTNYHVVANATDVEVSFADGTTAKAEVLGGDPNADLAVIKVDVPASELTPVTLGDSDQAQVGQLTIAIGSPFGQEFTMTSGIVSAVGRTIQSGNTAFSIPQAIQTDTPINPGNSGGPLLNRQGAVIGINSQILSRTGGNNGVGFAVPINTAKQVVPTLIKGENYEYAWLGISGATVDSEIIKAMNLPADTQGALVIDMTKDGPAAKAGLAGSDQTLTVAGAELQIGGDVITAINGQPIKAMDDLISYLIQNTRPDDTVKLDVIRAGGKSETIDVTLGVRPSAEELSQAQDK